MGSWLRSRRGTLMLSALVWAAGCLFIWWALPVVPRSWRPPADQKPLGFLSDGRTLVTVTPQHAGLSFVGPIQLWNVESGLLVASHFSPDVTFERLRVDRLHDRLEVQQRRVDDGTSSNTFDLRLLDAHSALEITHFPRQLPGSKPISNGWWETAPDGQTIAFMTVENGQAQFEWHDVASGRLLRPFLGVGRSTVCFSPNGRRLLHLLADAPAEGPKVFTVWDVPSGHEIASFPVPTTPGDYNNPTELSPDGELVLAGRTKVWEATTGKLRFEVADASNAFATFSEDSRWLIVEHRTMAESWLSWYDVATGEEQLGKQLSVQKAERMGNPLRRADANGHFLLLTGSYTSTPPGPVWSQLAQLPLLRSLGVDSTTKDRWFLIDEKNGREVAHGDEIHCESNPQGTLLLTTDRQQRHLLWDVPPRKPLAWFLALAAVLGLLVTLVTHRRLRRLQPDAPKEPAPTPTPA